MKSYSLFRLLSSWKRLSLLIPLLLVSTTFLLVTSVSAAVGVTATKTDAIIGDDGDGKADPGETIEYTVTLSNPSGTDVTGVEFDDNPDTNTAFVSGSTTASPVALNDTFPVTVVGNVSIDSAALASPFSVTANDFLGVNPLATITVFDATTTNGGQVVMTTSGGNMGKFTYDPPAGFEGTDTFTYTLTDNANASSALANRTATVSITVSGMVWFINNGAGACVAAGCGRLSNPFSTLAAFNTLNDGTGNHPNNNDNIFIYESGAQYTGAVTLRSGQKLIGQDATVSLETITGLTPPTGSPSFPTMNSGNGTITNLGSTVSLNTNATVRGLQINSTTSTGMNDPAGAITGVGVSEVDVTTTSGTAVALSDLGGTLSFRSISANGATNGIALTNTTGSFTVTGNSSGLCGGSVTNTTTPGTPATVTGANTADCTGGTIQATTGAGISLTNVQSVSLTRIRILNSGTDGMIINTVNGFTLDHSNISDNSGVAQDRGIEIGDFSTGTAVNGTINITNSSIGPTPHDSLAMGVSSGTSTWNITGTQFNNTGNSGIDAELRGSAVFTALMVDGNVFAGSGGCPSNSARGVFVNNLDDSVMTLATIQNNTFTNNQIHVDMNQQNDTDPVGSHTFKVKDNTLTGACSHAMNIFAAAGSFGGSFTGRVEGNVIGSSGTTGSGSQIGNGIRVNINGGSDATLLIDDNTIRQTPNGRGIEVIGRNGTGGLDITITNNDVNPQASSAPLAAILVQSNCLTICNTVRADVRSNTVPSATDVTDLLTTYLELVESSTSTLEMVDTTSPVSGTCASELAATNTGSTGVLGGCALIAGPINTAMLLNLNQFLVFADGKQTTARAHTTAATNTSIVPANDLDSNLFKQTSDTVPLDALKTIGARAASSIGGTGAHESQPQFAPAQAGGIVSVNIGTLPTGKSVIIKFRVTVNGPSLPLGTFQLSNQGTVSFDPSQSVLTDDTAVGGTSDPTTTPVDRPDTTVTSVNRNGSNPTNASSVSWDVTFPTAITGLTSSNLSLVNTGLGGTPAISTVTPVGGSPATVWTVTASTGTGQGTLGLNMVNDTSLSHDVTNLTFTGEVYDIDHVAPTTTSFTRQTPSTTPTNADTLVFRVTFSEAVQNVGTADFAATGTTGTPTGVSPVSTGVYDVTVSGGDLAGFNGVVGLNFSGTLDITDLAGNPVANTEPATDETYTVDNTAPTTTSFTRQTPSTTPTNADTLVFRATFSDAVIAIDTADFAVSGSTTATVTNVSFVSAGVYDVTVSGGDLAGFNGVVGLNFSGGMDITDAAGNALANTEPATDETYTVDNTAPGVTVNQASGQADPTATSPVNFTVIFSQAVTGFGNNGSDVTLSGSAVPTTAVVTEIAPNDGTTYNVAVSGMSGSGTVIADIPSGAAQDAATNGNAASTSTDNTITYVLDTTPPDVTINQASGQSDPTSGSPIHFMAVFNEPVTGFGDSASDVTLSGTALPTTAVVTEVAPMDGTTYDVAVSGMSASGTVIADIPANAAKDGANNDNNASTSTDKTVTFVLSSTTVTINQAAAQSDPTSTSPINFTAVFNVPVTGFGDSSGDVSLSGSANATTAVVSGGPTTYNVAVSGMTSNGTVIATIPSDVVVGGNGASTSTDNTVTYDQGLQSGPTFTVNVLADTDDGACDVLGSGIGNQDCTLREAINAANGQAGANTIDFGVTGTITLVGSSLPAINDNVTIDGTGQSIVVSGATLYRVLSVNSGKTLNLNALTIANGTCTACDGGGIANAGTLSVTNSTLSSNSASSGGGILSSGSLTLINSTLSGNSASFGGALYNLGTATLTNSTLSDNIASSQVGGIENDTGTLHLRNTIIANSTGDNCRNNGGTVATNINNLIEPTSNCGTPLFTSDPNLGPLQDNDGPTFTMKLGNDSDAIDEGDDAVCAAAPVSALDQRGKDRNDLHCDIGAFEFVNADEHTVIKDGLTAGNTYSYGPTLAQFLLASGDPGTLAMNRELTPPPNSPPANALPITWDATATASPFDLTVTLCYDPAVLTGQNESTLHVYHYNGSSWVDLAGSLDTVTYAPYHCVTAGVGLTTLSPLALAPGATTAVSVTGFKGQVGKNGAVQLNWRTLNESFITGFNVYRKVGKKDWVQVNKQFRSAKHPGSPQGANYRFKDAKVKAHKKYRYKIEILYTDNHTEWTNVIRVKTP